MAYADMLNRAETGRIGLFDQLRESCAKEWQAYVAHPFVRALADGSLPEACFRKYLIQDYLFLVHFARAYGLAAYKSETLADIRAAAQSLSAIVDREILLHIDVCRTWGLDEQTIVSVPEADATMAYTRYVLEKGLAGDLLDLAVALAPCIAGYGEIGTALKNDPSTQREGNPYTDWIESYAAEDYQAITRQHIAQIDMLYARRGGDTRLPALATTFRQATQLETAFWTMAFSIEPT